MDIQAIKLEIPEGSNIIFGQSHFIKTVEDLKGLKMRTPPIDVTIRTFKALGANPQQVAYTETYMALKTGVVDGQENPFSNAVDMKFYEAQKYLSVVNWQVHPDPFFVNLGWYKSLPDDLKAVFDAVAEATMIYSDTIWLNSEQGYYNILKDKLEVNHSEAKNRKGFVDGVKSVWQLTQWSLVAALYQAPMWIIHCYFPMSR